MSETPMARIEGIVVEDLDDHTVVYDTATSKAHALDAAAAAVWKSADGTRDVAALADHTGLREDVVLAALDQLSAGGLLSEPAGLSRRRVLNRGVTIAAAAVAAAPLVETLVIPTAAAHASTPSIVNGNGGTQPSGNPPGVPAGAVYFVSVTIDSKGNITGTQAGGWSFAVASPQPQTISNGPSMGVVFQLGESGDGNLLLIFSPYGATVYSVAPGGAVISQPAGLGDGISVSQNLGATFAFYQ